MTYTYSVECPSFEKIKQFLYESKDEYEKPLNERIDIEQYALKLYSKSSFVICKDKKSIIGMICCYTNRPPIGYISNVCILSKYQGKGIFKHMFIKLIQLCNQQNIKTIQLEVGKINLKAYNVYKHFGFIPYSETSTSLYMKKTL